MGPGRRTNLSKGHSNGNGNGNGNGNIKGMSTPNLPPNNPQLRKRTRVPVLRYMKYGLMGTFLAMGLRFSIFRTPSDEYYSNLYYQALAEARTSVDVNVNLGGSYKKEDASSSSILFNDNDNDNDKYGCTIPRLRIDDKESIGLGSKIGPVLLVGWNIKEDEWTQSSLIDYVGEYPQYLKDLTVQPYQKNSHSSNQDLQQQQGLRNSKLNNKKKKPKHDDMCILQTKDIVELLPQRDNLLLFTNNKENQPFMKNIKQRYTIPKIVQHITSFQVFSALGKDQYHSMHAHGETWLGQVAGRRMWWFLPPDTHPPPARVDACGYLSGQHAVPATALRCLQKPGDVIWFPKDWFHATCALDDWNAGIGAQQGPPIRQQFPKLTSYHQELAKATKNGSYENWKRNTLDVCGLAEAKKATPSANSHPQRTYWVQIAKLYPYGE